MQRIDQQIYPERFKKPIVIFLDPRDVGSKRSSKENEDFIRQNKRRIGDSHRGHTESLDRTGFDSSFSPINRFLDVHKSNPINPNPASSPARFLPNNQRFVIPTSFSFDKREPEIAGEIKIPSTDDSNELFSTSTTSDFSRRINEHLSSNGRQGNTFRPAIRPVDFDNRFMILTGNQFPNVFYDISQQEDNIFSFNPNIRNPPPRRVGTSVNVRANILPKEFASGSFQFPRPFRPFRPFIPTNPPFLFNQILPNFGNFPRRNPSQTSNSIFNNNVPNSFNFNRIDLPDRRPISNNLDDVDAPTGFRGQTHRNRIPQHINFNRIPQNTFGNTDLFHPSSDDLNDLNQEISFQSNVNDFSSRLRPEDLGILNRVPTSNSLDDIDSHRRPQDNSIFFNRIPGSFDFNDFNNRLTPSDLIGFSRFT